MDKKYPKVVVGCFIRNDNGEVLLVKSYKWPDIWIVMGGHVEWGETIAEAVVREVKEEVGLVVVYEHVVEVAEFVNDPSFHKQKHFIALQCECHVVGDDTPQIDNDEIQEARWFALEEAKQITYLLPATKHTLTLLT